MTLKELKTLEKALNWADEYFTSYCEVADVYVYDQDEIDQMEDEDEQFIAQENKDYEDLLDKAHKIIEKYKKEVK